MELIWLSNNLQPTRPPAGGILAPEITRMNWEAVGGSRQAEADVKAGLDHLWQLIPKIGAGVQIEDEQSRPVWFGHLYGVTLPLPGWSITVTMEQMYNAVAVRYTETPEGETTSVDGKTAWAEDLNSIGHFGRRELLQTIGEATETAAERQRDRILEQSRLLHATHYPGGAGANERSASLSFIGWWDTFHWRMAQEAEGANVETTAQIQTLASHNPFINNIIILNNSGLFTNPYRDGGSTLGNEIENLLALGTSAGRRLLSAINQNRDLIVWQEPERPSPQSNNWWTLDDKHKLRNRYNAPEELPITGIWTRMREQIPHSALFGFADIGHFLIESVEWTKETGYLYQPQGQNIWQPEDAIEGYLP